MSDDLLTTARGFLRASSGMDSMEGYTAATAHAIVDAAQTLRRIEAQRAEHLNPSMPCARCGDNGEYAIGGNPNDPDMKACDCQPAPDAPATPQEGEVWEDPRGRRWQISEVTRHANVWVCRAGGWPPLHIDPANGWRRVSPAPAPLTEPTVPFQKDSLGTCSYKAPAPLTEREVTAEAEAQGVEPASDEQVAQVIADLDYVDRAGMEPHRLASTVRALIARVRADEARARAAEAQVARLLGELSATVARVGWFSDAPDLNEAIRAYREANRGE